MIGLRPVGLQLRISDRFGRLNPPRELRNIWNFLTEKFENYMELIPKIKNKEALQKKIQILNWTNNYIIKINELNEIKIAKKNLTANRSMQNR